MIKEIVFITQPTIDFIFTYMNTRPKAICSPSFGIIVMLFLIASCAGSKKISSSRKYDPLTKGERKATSKYEKRTDQRVDTIIKTARSFTGTPYRWGGTSRAGMDCSGLLVTSFQSAGINLPRTTSEQIRVGHGIRLYELQPGDLVFFAAKNRNPNKVTHVGMITEVRTKHDVRFIHASTKLGVTENNIYSSYYRKIFVEARRPF
jgi:probable lipoprotein NlpC